MKKQILCAVCAIFVALGLVSCASPQPSDDTVIISGATVSSVTMDETELTVLQSEYEAAVKRTVNLKAEIEELTERAQELEVEIEELAKQKSALKEDISELKEQQSLLAQSAETDAAEYAEIPQEAVDVIKTEALAEEDEIFARPGILSVEEAPSEVKILPELPAPQPIQEEQPEVQPESEKISGSYVLNTNTKKFHLSTCASANSMKAENRQYTDSREYAINNEYDPCKNCKP